MTAESSNLGPDLGPEAAATVFDFVQHFLDDQSSGRERPLDHYLRLYPGHDEMLQAEYERLNAPPDTSSPVDRVEHYRLVRELGQGGQGSVWLAEDERLGRPVALKLMNSWLIAGERMARFRREAASIAKLEHEGLAVVYEANMEGAQPYIAMRLVDGEDLGTCLAQEKAIAKQSFCKPATTQGVRAALLFFERAARALHAAHEAGVVHRDIKPSNIMVTGEGKPVVTDFGLAVDEFTPGEETITREGEIFGTPAYMSPEQVEGRSQDVDRRTDVWSLGASLFETLTGKPPFEGKGHIGLAKAILEDPIPNPRTETGSNHIPQDVVVVLQTAMERDLGRRYATALEFAEDLRRIREYEPIQARPANAWLRLRRWCRREPALAVVMVGLVVGLSASLVMLRRISTALDVERSMRFVRQIPPLLQKSPSDALAVSLEAVKMHDSWITRSSLFGPLEALSLTARGSLLDDRVAWSLGHLESEDKNGHERAFVSGSTGLYVFSAQDGSMLAHRSFGSEDLLDVYECVEVPGKDSLIFGGTLPGVYRVDVDTLKDQWTVPMESAIQSLAMHPDGKSVFALTSSHGGYLMDVTDGKVIRRFPVLPETASLGLFSRDGTRLLTCSRSKRNTPASSISATLWNVTTGFEVATLPHAGAIQSASFSQDGGRIATGTLKGEVFIWNAMDGTFIEMLPPLTKVVESLDWSKGDRLLAAGDWKGAWLYSFVAGSSLGPSLASEWIPLPSKKEAVVGDVLFDPTGEFLAGASYDNAIRVWNTTSHTLAREHLTDNRPTTLEWSSNGQGLISAGLSSYLFFWKAHRPNNAFRLHGDGSPMTYVEFAPGAKRAVIANANGRVTLIETPLDPKSTLAGEVAFELANHGEVDDSGNSKPVKVLCAVAETAQRAVSARGHGRVLLHDLDTGNVLAEFANQLPGIRDLSISPDGRWVALVNELGILNLWNPDTGSQFKPLGTKQQIHVVTFDGASERLAAGDALGDVLVWNCESGELLLYGVPEEPEEQVERDPVVDLKFDPTGTYIHSAQHVFKVNSWDLTQPNPKVDQQSRMWHKWLNVSPSGMVITVGPGRGTMQIGYPKGPVPSTMHTNSITCTDLHPNDKWIATGSLDNHVLVSNWKTKKTLCRYDMHAGPVRCVAFSPLAEDSRVLSASDDGTVALWQVDPMGAAQRLAPHGLTIRQKELLSDWGQ